MFIYFVHILARKCYLHLKQRKKKYSGVLFYLVRFFWAPKGFRARVGCLHNASCQNLTAQWRHPQRLGPHDEKAASPHRKVGTSVPKVLSMTFLKYPALSLWRKCFMSSWCTSVSSNVWVAVLSDSALLLWNKQCIVTLAEGSSCPFTRQSFWQMFRLFPLLNSHNS